MASRFSLCSFPTTKPHHAPSVGRIESSRLRIGYIKSSKLVTMCSKNHISVDTNTKSSIKNKIFEDQSAGIVCYRDENGEIICEGYDEGPRFHHKLSTFNYHTRDVEIIQLFQRCWLQVATKEETYYD